MSDSIDDRLKQMREDAEKTIAMDEETKRLSVLKQKRAEGEKKEETKRNVIDLNQFMEAMNHGSVVQIYRKKEKIVVETSPLFNKWLLFSLCVNALLFVVLLTKAAGLW